MTKKMYKLIVFISLLLLFGCSIGKEETKTIKEVASVNKSNVSELNKEVVNSSLTMEQVLIDANSLFNKKDYAGAIVQYEELLNKGSLNPEILNNLFVSYIYTGEYRKGINIISFLVSQVGEKEGLVGSYISEGNLSDNIVELQKKINTKKEKDPNDLLEYAKLLYKAGDYYYEKDSKKYYFAIMFHYLLAYLTLDDAIILDPDNSELYFYQGWLIMDIANSYEDSQKKLEKAIELKQDDFRYYYRLGNAYMHQDKHKLAKEVFLKGIELNNQYEKLHLNLGNTYFDLGEKEKGYLSYQTGLKVCKEMCDAFYYNTGNQLYNQAKYKEAKKAYETSIELNPNNKKAINMLKKTNGLISIK